MAVYVTATKIEDNEEYVLYKYGFNPDSLVGSFSINKDLTHWKLINDAGVPVSGLVYKICKTYIKTNNFPNEISFQA